MKKFALVPALLVVALAGLSTGARASAVNVVVTGAYSSSAPSTSFSTASAMFSVTFSLPMNIGSSLTVAAVPLTISFNGTDTPIPTAMLTFFPALIGGGFNIDFSYDGDAYEWDLFGSQLYDSSDNLLLGRSPISPTFDSFISQLVVTGNRAPLVAPISAGSLTMSTGTITSATPEPASLLLLGTGLLGLGIAIRHRHGRA